MTDQLPTYATDREAIEAALASLQGLADRCNSQIQMVILGAISNVRLHLAHVRPAAQKVTDEMVIRATDAYCLAWERNVGVTDATRLALEAALGTSGSR